jgi:hypothetical protein
LEALLQGKEGFLNCKLHVAYTKGNIAMLQQNYQAAVNYSTVAGKSSTSGKTLAMPLPT